MGGTWTLYICRLANVDGMAVYVAYVVCIEVHISLCRQKN